MPKKMTDHQRIEKLEHEVALLLIRYNHLRKAFDDFKDSSNRRLRGLEGTEE